jgi:hypothetical protein
MWHATATTITAEQAEDRQAYLTLAEVCERTALRQVTITQAIARRGPFAGDKPIHALSRPRYLVDSTGEPRWGSDQLRDYWTVEAGRARTVQERYGHLEVVTDEQAKERGLVGLRTINRICGRALTTLHRWSERADFPPLVAQVKTSSPQPRLLREWSAVRAYLLANDNTGVDYPEVVPDDAWKPLPEDDIADEVEEEVDRA